MLGRRTIAALSPLMRGVSARRSTLAACTMRGVSAITEDTVTNSPAAMTTRTRAARLVESSEVSLDTCCVALDALGLEGDDGT